MPDRPQLTLVGAMAYSAEINWNDANVLRNVDDW